MDKSDIAKIFYFSIHPLQGPSEPVHQWVFAFPQYSPAPVFSSRQIRQNGDKYGSDKRVNTPHTHKREQRPTMTTPDLQAVIATSVRPLGG